ncbi:MAG: radical SAM protein [Bacteroidales bacterium]
MINKHEIYGVIDSLDEGKYLAELEPLRSCTICPRKCGVNRLAGETGYCRADASFTVSSICRHMGEEPVISGPRGICNVFFTQCNLQCLYCQNYQISRNDGDYRDCRMELKDVLRNIVDIMAAGTNMVGFVSPTHYVPQVKAIMAALKDVGLDPVFVYNTNGYDTVETLRSLEGHIQVYMPDFKYSSPELARHCSGAEDYPEAALRAHKEMYQQIGSAFITMGGYLIRGILIRHLVLPGHTGNSIGVLRMIAREISTNLHISLMSQYYPNPRVMDDPSLCKTLHPGDYYRVVEAMEALGFTKGWVQEMSSARTYNPDFRRQHPFESM